MRRNRFFSLIATLLIISLVLSGCFGNANQNNNNAAGPSNNNQQSVTENTNNVGPSDIATYKQSPILDGQGLPPVEERLPVEPKITNEMAASQLNYEIGRYGGKMRTVTTSPNSNGELFVMLNEPLINTPGLLGEEITGNVVKDIKVNADETEFTFTMREGLKWSDGVPVTIEDVRFGYEDVLMNPELTPSFPAKYKTGAHADGEPMELEIIDEQTFKITFSESYGGFLMQISIQGWESYNRLIKPRHYLEQFHIDYADPDELKKLTVEAGYEETDWFNLFHEKDIVGSEVTNAASIGFPVLNPWMLTRVADNIQFYERNPYYFKVDAEGNQLPYIDYAESHLMSDNEMLNLQIISGGVDYTRPGIVDMALYKQNESNGYIAELRDQHSRPGNIYLNQTFEDETWRSLAQDVRFRQAVNLAVNNEEIIDAIYFGYADLPSEFNTSTYDPDEANRLLDEIGMDQRDNEGFRLSPDGERFDIQFEVFVAAEIVPQTELIVEYLNDLGLRTSMRTIDQSLWNTRIAANEIQATLMRMEDYWWQGDIKLDRWGTLWHQYFATNGEQGLEPPVEVKQLFDKAAEVKNKSPEDGLMAFKELQEMVKEHLFFIVTAEKAQQPVIVNENLRNIPHDGTAIAINFAAEQFFYTD